MSTEKSLGIGCLYLAIFETSVMPSEELYSEDKVIALQRRSSIKNGLAAIHDKHPRLQPLSEAHVQRGETPPWERAGDPASACPRG